MRYLIPILLAIPFKLLAQDSTTYSEFRFTIIDNISKKDLTSDVLGARISDVFFTDSTQKDLDYVFTKLEYSKKDSCWILSQTQPLGYNYKIEVYRLSDTVNQKLMDLRKMVLIYNGYNSKNNSGCKYCLCNDIPFTSGIYTIDIPRKVESWLYIRSVSINVKNIPVEFRDISGIQNWFFRKE